jgi:hypothetical protein
MENITVLYILSSQRSGSTLLDRMLGQIPGFFSVGELRYIWHRGLAENQLCGCGEPFRACPFWKPVIERYQRQHPETANLAEIDRLSQVTGHYRYTPLCFLPRWMGRRFEAGRMVDRYARALGVLYGAIQAQSQARVIVDSSKSYPYALAVARLSQVNLHVVHLVRDSRAVAFSHQRVRRRPEITGRAAFMGRLSLWESCLSWNTVNALAPTLRLRGVASYQRIHYETVVRAPEETLRRIMTRILGECPRLEFLDGCSIHLEPNHSVAGNPIRFTQGKVQLQLDDEWRLGMAAARKWAVTVLTLPLLAYYGY